MGMGIFVSMQYVRVHIIDVMSCTFIQLYCSIKKTKNYG